jgi:hypothetical protein
VDPLNPKPYIDLLVQAAKAALPLVKRVGLKKKQRKAFEELLAASNDGEQQAELARRIDELAALAPADPMSRVLTSGTKKLLGSKKPAARKMASKKPAGKKAPAAGGHRYSAAKAFKSATKASGKKAAAKKPAARKRRAN